jgi:hypothetical protein
MDPKQSETKFSVIILVLILVIVLPGIPKCVLHPIIWTGVKSNMF